MHDSSPVRYGVIGTGMMGTEHICNLGALPGAVVTAIADPDEISRKQGAVAVGASAEVAQFEHHRDLLASGLVDAVVVATPDHTHIDVIPDVLRSGVHALIEKPLCTTVEDCRTVLDLASGSDAVIQVGLEYRYMPPVARLIDEVRAGTVGVPRMVAIREHRFPFLAKVGDWNRFTEYTGGTLVEKCCHFFDLMNVILDERPVRVMASGGQDVNHLDETYDGRPADMLDNAFVIVEYGSGARASLDLCMFADATFDQEEISVVGALGKVEARLPHSELRIGRRGEHWIGSVEIEEVHDASIAFQGLHHGSSYLEHRQFLASVRGELPVPVSLEDGLWSVAMGVAAHRSIELRRPIDLEEVLS